MRTSVFSVPISPSFGSCWRKSATALADCHTRSSKVPSSLGGCSTRVASAVAVTCGRAGLLLFLCDCAEAQSGKEKLARAKNATNHCLRFGRNALFTEVGDLFCLMLLPVLLPLPQRVMSPGGR